VSEPDRDLAGLNTERARADLADLDTRTVADLVQTINREDATVPAAVAEASRELSAAVTLLATRLESGGRLVYAGAGTPGRLCAVDAAECAPTFGTDPGLTVPLLAGGPTAFMASVEGAEDDRSTAASDVTAAEVGVNDVIVAVSASGRTPYALGAVETAAASGAATVGVSNNPRSELSRLVDVAIEVDTGPEVVAGSTRMKAGTAQKLVLNTLSTAAMIRLGKTYGNFMVDLQAGNAKLRDRAVRIVATTTGANPHDCARALDMADGHAKTAVVMLLGDLDAAQARERLRNSGGRTRDALAVSGEEPAAGGSP